MLKVIEAIRQEAGANRFAPAIIGPGRYLTYAELLAMIARVSNSFADRGLPPRSKVLLNFADGDLRFIATLACIHYGLIPFVVVNAGDARDDIDHDFVVGSPAQPYDRAVPVDFAIDAAVLEGRLGDPQLRAFPDRAEDEVLFIAATTGTTGRKKLVAQTLAVLEARHAGNRTEYQRGDRVLVAIGDASKYGTGMGLRLLQKRAAIARGGANAEDALRLMNMFSVNKLVATPAVLNQLVAVAAKGSIRCPALKAISITGSLFTRQFLQRLESVFDAELFVNYGSAETGIISRGKVDSAGFRPGYVGEVHPTVTLVSAGTAEEPAPVTVVNDQGRFCNYYSRGKVIPNTSPFYTLPDLGYADGRSLYLVGREDEVFNADGNKVAFGVIEAALRDLAGIRDVGIVGGDPAGDAGALVIGLVVDDGFDLQSARDAVTAVARTSGAAGLLRIFRCKSVKRNPTGKIDRKALLGAYVLARATGTEPSGY